MAQHWDDVDWEALKNAREGEIIGTKEQPIVPLFIGGSALFGGGGSAVGGAVKAGATAANVANQAGAFEDDGKMANVDDEWKSQRDRHVLEHGVDESVFDQQLTVPDWAKKQGAQWASHADTQKGDLQAARDRNLQALAAQQQAAQGLRQPSNTGAMAQQAAAANNQRIQSQLASMRSASPAAQRAARMQQAGMQQQMAAQTALTGAQDAQARRAAYARAAGQLREGQQNRFGAEATQSLREGQHKLGQESLRQDFRSMGINARQNEINRQVAQQRNRAAVIDQLRGYDVQKSAAERELGVQIGVGTAKAVADIISDIRAKTAIAPADSDPLDEETLRLLGEMR